MYQSLAHDQQLFPSPTLRMGFRSDLLPFLTVGNVVSISEGRGSLCVPPTASKRASSDCVSTTTLLMFRGIGAGVAWTIGVDGYALANKTSAEWQQQVAAHPVSSVSREVAKSLARLSVRNMLGFATFLGIFSGVSCALEKGRGKSDLLNPFVGGCTAGTVILPRELRNPRTLLTAAILCGSASVALHYFIPSGDKKNESVVIETR
uniref:Mitochondrial import inner membrane translocase subunit TIM22 n=1 Tax=Peronospora matthiolae TaxID=2874970 RepID=A0AAV1TRG6_9STRA